MTRTADAKKRVLDIYSSLAADVPNSDTQTRALLTLAIILESGSVEVTADLNTLGDPLLVNSLNT